MTRMILTVAVVAFAVAGAASVQSQSDLFNYGRQWNSWSDAVRSAYLDGFIDGQSNTYLALANDLPQDRREPLRLKTFTFYGADAIRNVITNLYSDPANTFIRYDAMVYIARDKLHGKDVEPKLRNSRKHDRGFVRKP